MKRVVLGVVLSFALLVGMVASPASADNPPGYPDLVGFAVGTFTPPAPTVPAVLFDPAVPDEFGRMYFDDPTLRGEFYGPVGVGVLSAVSVVVAREVAGDPTHLQGFYLEIIGVHTVSGPASTLIGFVRMATYEADESGTTYGPRTPYQPGAVTLIDGG